MIKSMRIDWPLTMLLLVFVMANPFQSDAPRKHYENDFRFVFLYEESERLSLFNKDVLAADRYFESNCYVQRHKLSEVKVYDAHEDLIMAMRSQSELAEDERKKGSYFYRLHSPYHQSKKTLRAVLEHELTHSQFTEMAQRLVPIIDAHEYAHGPSSSEQIHDHAFNCDQLSDDMDYFKWSFTGVGLDASEATLSLIKSCAKPLFQKICGPSKSSEK